jgi:hypothetical protein
MLGEINVWTTTVRTFALVQAFSSWIHICAIRLFVESILRYGLPPKFLAALMKPNQKSTARLRKVLASLFGNSGDACIPDNVKHLSNPPSQPDIGKPLHIAYAVYGELALREYAEAVSMHPLEAGTYNGFGLCRDKPVL